MHTPQQREPHGRKHALPAGATARRAGWPWTLLAAAVVAIALGGCSGPNDGPASDASADASANDGLHNDVSGIELHRISPDRGPLAGGDEVELEGLGFGPAAQVYFGKREAEVTWRAGSTRLVAVVPEAGVPGPVDVRIVDVDGTATLASGYAYLTEVRVDAIEPELGPDVGGTPIVVRGAGFSPGDRVLIGWRAAQGSVVADGTSILATTPAITLPAGKDELVVPVAVRHASGVTSLIGGFRYGRRPRLLRLEPAVVGPAGGAVTLHGEGLGTLDAVWIDGRYGTLSPGSASSVRGATVPTLANLGGSPRAVAVAVRSPYGDAILDPGLVYGGAASPALYGVAPADGSSAGGDTVALLVDLAGGTASAATFGGAAATGLDAAASAPVATSPSLAVGLHDVTVQTSKGNASKAQAWRTWAPVTIANLNPPQGPVAGGTTVALKGNGLRKDCSVRFGAWPAPILAETKDGLSVRSPAGPPGPVDVTVRCGPHQVVRVDGFDYLPTKPQLDIVTPGDGASGGGAIVTLHGAGLSTGCAVAFGGKAAEVIEVVSSGAMRVKTPAHEPGTVTVAISCKAGHDALIDGFTFFSPTNPQGGTHGAPVAGTLNVTVLDIYTLKPLAGATVVVGQPGDAVFGTYLGKTDAKGQIIFSGLDLVPPLTVSASKNEYSASSIVQFTVSNATLLLFPYVPPSPGGGGGGGGLPLATLEGRVLDLDKYVLVPPTSCLKPETGGPICDFCSDVSACGAETEWACSLTGGVTRRCFPQCKTNDDCPQDYRCYDDTEVQGRRVCKPSIGVRRITCQTSTRGLETENPPPGPGSVVDEATGKWSISARLDELAVYCVAGYVMADQSFVPTSMGVRRHIFPQPGGTISNLDLRLDIALQRKLPVRLDHPQRFFPAQNGGTLDLRSWIDLGSDGFIPLATELREPEGLGSTGVVDALTIPYQPLILPEALTDTSQTWRAVVGFGTALTPIETGTQHESIIRPGDNNLLVRSKAGQWQASPLAVAMPLRGMVRGDGDEVLLVSDRGRLLRGPIDGPSLLYVPTVADAYEQPPAVLAMAGTPTDATIVGEAGLIRRLDGDTVLSESGALVEDLVGVCQVGTLRAVVGAKGGMAIDSGGGWTKVGSFGAPGRAVACNAERVVFTSADGHFATLDVAGGATSASIQVLAGATSIDAALAETGGSFLLAGSTADSANAGLWRLGSAGTTSNAWPSGAKQRPAFTLLVAGAPGTIYGVTEAGQVLRIDALGSHDEGPERRDMRAHAGVRLSDGTMVLAGEPGLWLGPFLTVPAIAKPAETQNVPLLLEWSAAPGTLPTINRVHIDGATTGFPFWWMYTAPAATAIVVPDFLALAGIFVWNDQSFVARVDRIWTPSLSIDAFGTFDVEFGDWRSWATNGKGFQL